MTKHAVAKQNKTEGTWQGGVTKHSGVKMVLAQLFVVVLQLRLGSKAKVSSLVKMDLSKHKNQIG